MVEILVNVYQADVINSPNEKRFIAVSSFDGNNVYGYGKTPEESLEKWLEQVKKKEMVTKEVQKDGKGFAINLP